MGLGIIGLLFASLLWAATSVGDDSSDTDEEDAPPTPEDDTGDDMFPDMEALTLEALGLMPGETDAEEQDLGATVTEREDGSFFVELGEDETGTLVLFDYSDTEDAGIGLREDFQYRLYLVPEGVTIPEGDDGFGGADIFGLEEELGLELLATWNLGALVPIDEEPFEQDNRVDPPVITSDDPITVYTVVANTDGDDILSIRPEDYVPPPPTYLGVERVAVAEDTTGTAGTDYFETSTAGITIDGADGADRIESNAANTTLLGGEGDDSFFATQGPVSIDGGADNDVITADSGTVRGGDGEDTIQSLGSDGPLLAFGDAGNDIITLYGATSEANGGAGDDTINLNDGATGSGGDGADRIQLQRGTVADGGAGDDLFTVWDFNDEPDTSVITGGTGADTYDFRVRIPVGDQTADFARITDFDPAEDVLQIGAWDSDRFTVDSITIVEAMDGSHTDVEIRFANTDGLAPGLSIVRLDGVTGFTADQVVVLS